MPRKQRPKSRREVVYRKRLLSRKAKTRKITIVSRVGQPQVTVEVPQLKQGDVGGRVASSWISALAWDQNRGFALMNLINGYLYDVFIPFKIFEEWFYAHSKGTYFNGNIKGKFKVVRVL